MSYILVFIAGGLLGVFTMCALVAAGQADDREEKWFDDKGRGN